MGAVRVNDFPCRANGYGQASGDHASSRTSLDNAERLTGIYGSEGRARTVPERMVGHGSWRSLTDRPATRRSASMQLAK